MRTIVIFEKWKPVLLERVREVFPPEDWRMVTGNECAEEELLEAEIVVGWRRRAEKELLSPSSKLKWVHNWSAGVDHLPLNAMHAKGLSVTDVSGVHPYPISETIFAMLLSFTRKIHTYIRNQIGKKWDHAGLKHEVHEKTIGIVGVGAIGSETARIAKAFRMKVIGVRRSGEPSPYVDEMVTPDQLPRILPQCDYVVVTMPLTDETRHMFGAEQFLLMKPTAFFINIGRGATVDTEALLEALQNNRIAGAGLDVFEQEPLPQEHPFWEMEQVIMTPHSAGSTENYNERAMEIFLNNAADYLEGKEPGINRVDPMKNY